MKHKKQIIYLLACLVPALIVVVTVRGQSSARARDLTEIERLHQQDIAATVAGNPKALAELWAEDAVRLEPGLAEVGKKLIVQHDAETMQKNGEMKILTYAPEIQDLKIVDDWAFEWGYFKSTYRESPTSPVKSFRGKLLRVLEKQKDGSWKFARVMWNAAEEK